MNQDSVGMRVETAEDIRAANAELRAQLEREVLQRNRAEEEIRTLRAAEERLRFALESAGVGIWESDFTTGRHAWSETLEALHGLQPGTFDGTSESCIARIHPDDRESVRETMESAMKTGGNFTVRSRTLWPDGTVRWLNGAGRVHLGARGEPVRYVGICIDVTERHTLEAQFQQAQKMEAIGRLAGGVAHDFNNLLTAILGYCELMLGDIDASNPLHADIAEIQKAGMSAVGLTRQLLAFSRKAVIEPTLLDVNALVTDFRSMLGRIIREDVQIVVDLQPGLPTVKADRSQMEQVIMNLAVNARDAMPHGGTLTITTGAAQLDETYAKTHLGVKPGPYVVLTISDSGMGMTPAVQEHLFEPFFTTKGSGKGTGLGLATVHGIVMGSGGHIDVTSTMDKGTSFAAYFPVAEQS